MSARKGLSWEEERLATFSQESCNWSMQADQRHPVGAADLAKNGFYYVGPGDTVRCYFCRLEVSDWHPGDTAENEHRRWNGMNCELLRGSFNSNVTLEEGRKKREQESQERKTADHAVAYHPQYAIYEARLKTFNEAKNWQEIDAKQSAETLANAGFFYSGVSDRVICFHCNLAFHNWKAEDDPLKIHTFWFPSCLAVLEKQKQLEDHEAAVAISASQ